ncbi:MAG: zf-TFIIB domain-containing protein [Polyangiales bacterium]
MSAEPEMACPACARPLTRINVPDHVIAGCGGCGGIWLDNQASTVVAKASLHPELWNIVESLDAIDTRLGALAVADRSYRQAAAGGGRRCPLCRDVLRQVFPVGEIEVDVCNEHGTFMDQHELRSIHNIVALERARRQEKTKSDKMAARPRGLLETIRDTLVGH